MFLIPVLFSLLNWTNEYHHLFYSGYSEEAGIYVQDFREDHYLFGLCFDSGRSFLPVPVYHQKCRILFKAVRADYYWHYRAGCF
jgi:hypothetical protein